MANVKFVDNTDIVLKRVSANAGNAMDQIAEMLVEAVQEQMLYGYGDLHGNPPHTEIVDTGKLFDSVDAEAKKVSQNAFTLSVGAGTHYAKYVHEGTSKLKGRPFVTDAVTGKVGEVQSILTAELPRGVT